MTVWKDRHRWGWSLAPSIPKYATLTVISIVCLPPKYDSPERRAAWGGNSYPRHHIGMSPSGKAQDFDSCIRWFESSHPRHTNIYGKRVKP